MTLVANTASAYAPDEAVDVSEKIDDIKKMSSGVVDPESYDFPRGVEFDTDYAILVQVQHDEWYRTNYIPNIYERLSYQLGEVDMILKHMTTFQKEREDAEDLTFTRLFLVLA